MSQYILPDGSIGGLPYPYPAQSFMPSTTATASYYSMPMERPPVPPPPSPAVGNRLRMLEQEGYFDGTDEERDDLIASLMAMYRPQTYLPPAYAQNMGGIPSAPNYYFPPEIPRGSPGGPISGPPPMPAPIVYPPSVNPAAFRSGKIANPEPEPEE